MNGSWMLMSDENIKKMKDFFYNWSNLKKIKHGIIFFECNIHYQCDPATETPILGWILKSVATVFWVTI